jgi:hypothetical protein
VAHNCDGVEGTCRNSVEPLAGAAAIPADYQTYLEFVPAIEEIETQRHSD